MNTRILIAVVVSMFVCQQVHAQEEPVMSEATELEGTWELVSQVVGGENHDVPDGYFWRFEGDRWYVRNDDESFVYIRPFSVDSSAVPAEIDIGRREMLGIYELDDDLLRICLGIPNEFEPETRPDRFESTEDPPTVLMVLRRVEDDE